MIDNHLLGEAANVGVLRFIQCKFAGFDFEGAADPRILYEIFCFRIHLLGGLFGLRFLLGESGLYIVISSNCLCRTVRKSGLFVGAERKALLPVPTGIRENAVKAGLRGFGRSYVAVQQSGTIIEIFATVRAVYMRGRSRE